MIKLWRCEICGDPYLGGSPPDNCPFCGAEKKYIKEAKDAEVVFEMELSDKDRENVEHALAVELSNSAFYRCAARETDDPEGRLLFKALGKVEAEHASIWRKVLGLDSVPSKEETCHGSNAGNLKESHEREERAVEFYKKAASEAGNERLRVLFEAVVEIESDHIGLSDERL